MAINGLRRFPPIPRSGLSFDSSDNDAPNPPMLPAAGRRTRRWIARVSRTNEERSPLSDLSLAPPFVDSSSSEGGRGCTAGCWW